MRRSRWRSAPGQCLRLSLRLSPSLGSPVSISSTALFLIARRRRSPHSLLDTDSGQASLHSLRSWVVEFTRRQQTSVRTWLEKLKQVFQRMTQGTPPSSQIWSETTSETAQDAEQTFSNPSPPRTSERWCLELRSTLCLD